MAEVFNIGLRIGKYELTRKLAEGGFGVLYVARDTELERELVIKFLLPEHAGNELVVQRFLTEGRAVAKITHPGIVTVYETGEVGNTGTAADGSAYIIMEYLVGETLAQRLARSGRLSVSVAMEITRQVANALQAAHDIGVVHRDLKPDNIMLIKDGSLSLGERAKVLDFGIAKQASAAEASRVHKTQQGLVFGTPIYMSPEQAMSTANATNQSDIYSLGCILFELLVGTPPFGGSMIELITHHVLTPAPIPSAKAPGIPPHLDQVIGAMMAKEPEERPASMKVVEAILEEKRVVASMARKRTLGGAKLNTQPPPLAGAQPSPAQVLAHAAGPPMHGAHQRYETGPQPPLVVTPPGQWPAQPTPVPGFAQPHHTPPPHQALVPQEVIKPTTPTTLNAATGVATNITSPTKKGKVGLLVGVGLIVAIGIAIAIITMRDGVEVPSSTPTDIKPATQPMTAPTVNMPATPVEPTPVESKPPTTTAPVELKPPTTITPVETKPETPTTPVVPKPATTTKPATTRPSRTEPTTTKPKTQPAGPFDAF